MVKASFDLDFSQFQPDENGQVSVADVTEILSQMETTPPITGSAKLPLSDKELLEHSYFYVGLGNLKR